MGVVIDWRKNPVLMQWWREGVAEGREELAARTLDEVFARQRTPRKP